jgi:predicted peptidase
MEYSVEVYQSIVKTVITEHDIYIEVVEEITNNRLQWSYLTSNSLYLIQTLYSLICEFPSKFAAAIRISGLNNHARRTTCQRT